MALARGGSINCRNPRTYFYSPGGATLHVDPICRWDSFLKNKIWSGSNKGCNVKSGRWKVYPANKMWGYHVDIFMVNLFVHQCSSPRRPPLPPTRACYKTRGCGGYAFVYPRRGCFLDVGGWVHEGVREPPSLRNSAVNPDPRTRCENEERGGGHRVCSHVRDTNRGGRLTPPRLP